MTTTSAYPISTPERDSLEAEVIDIVRQLSPDELRVFRFQGRRMIDIGHTKYGPLDLDADRRSWTDEIAQESSDRLFYQSCSEIARADRRRERLAAFKHANDSSQSGETVNATPSRGVLVGDARRVAGSSPASDTNNTPVTAGGES